MLLSVVETAAVSWWLSSQVVDCSRLRMLPRETPGRSVADGRASMSLKVKKVRIALYGLETHHIATERHLPHEITTYLPPDTGERTPS